MPVLFDLLVLAVFVIFAPYIQFGVVLGMIASTICTIFQPALLMGAIWFGFMGSYLAAQVPSPDVPYMNIIELVSQAQVFGVALPIVLFVIAGALVIAAFFTRQRDHETGRR